MYSILEGNYDRVAVQLTKTKPSNLDLTFWTLPRTFPTVNHPAMDTRSINVATAVAGVAQEASALRQAPRVAAFWRPRRERHGDATLRRR